MSRIFLKNLPVWVNEEILAKKFSFFGEITDIKIIQNNSIKKTKYCFIGFFKKESAVNTIKNSSFVFIGNQKIIIKKAYSFDYNRFKILKEKRLPKRIQLTNKKNFSQNIKIIENIKETGRLFVRNLSEKCEYEDIQNLFKPFGFLNSVCIPKKKSKFRFSKNAFIHFGLPECAVKAASFLDGKIFQGRILHIVNVKGWKKNFNRKKPKNLFSNFKKLNKKAKLEDFFSIRSWFTFFIPTEMLIKNLISTYGKNPKIIKNYKFLELNSEKLVLTEARLQNETSLFLKRQGINLQAFNPSYFYKKSNRIMIMKNFDLNSVKGMKYKFEKFGKIIKFINLQFTGFTFIEFQKKNHARKAFYNLEKYENQKQKYFIEWAPIDSTQKVNECKRNEIFNMKISDDYFLKKNRKIGKNNIANFYKKKIFVYCRNTKNRKMEEKEKFDPIKNKKSTKKILIRNIPFQSNLVEIKKIFEKFGKILYLRMPKKNNNQHRGFAFLEYKSLEEAKKAVVLTQNVHLYSRHLCVNFMGNI